MPRFRRFPDYSLDADVGRDAGFAAYVADDIDDTHDRRHHLFALRVDLGLIDRREGCDHDACSVLAGKALVDLFGHERHDGMKQLQDILEACVEDRRPVTAVSKPVTLP